MWEKKVFQVALPTHNNAKTIRACLKSVNKCLEKEQWHLVVGDNNSTDDTVNIIKDIIPELSCQTNLLLEFPDAINSATAKNRVLNVCGSFAQDRPCVLGMNPDGLMRPFRIKLYDKADIINEDEQLIVDLKTSADVNKFKSSAYRYKYDSQP